MNWINKEKSQNKTGFGENDATYSSNDATYSW